MPQFAARSHLILGSLVVGVKTIVWVVLLVSMHLLWNLQKNEIKGQNNFLTYHIQKKVSARPSEKCHFGAFFGGLVEAFRGKLAKLGVDNF